MSDAKIVELLRGVEFFQGIADEHLRRLAEISRLVEFPARYEIFQEYAPAKEVYVVISGRVSLAICVPKVGCRQLVEVGGGELIGWSPLVGRNRLTDTALTITPTKAIALDGEQVLALCREQPLFGFEFMHRAAMTLAERLGATRLQLMKVGGIHLPDVQIESD